MNTAYFDMYDIEVKLSPFVRYQDYGFVDSIEQFLLELKDEHLHNVFAQQSLNKEISKQSTKSVEGYCVYICSFLPYPVKNLYIAYLNLGSGIRNKGVKAHEQLHSLIIMNRLNLLEEKIKNTNSNATRKLSDLIEPELICNMGTVFALNQQGYSLKQIKNSLGIFSDKLIPEYLSI